MHSCVIVFSLCYITKTSMLTNTPTPIHLPNLWAGNTRDLQLRAGCRKFLRMRQCNKQANCEWKDGKCNRKAVRCRRITNELKCNANRNCEWLDARCRTISIPPVTTEAEGEGGSTTIGDFQIPKSVKDTIRSSLEVRDVENLCFCENTHVPLVSKTVTAIGNFLHGGNNCLTGIKLQTGGGSCPTCDPPHIDVLFEVWNHCVCQNSHSSILIHIISAFLSLLGLDEGGENCRCFN